MKSYKKFFVIFLMIIIIAGFILYKFHRRVRIDFINADTIISGDYTVKQKEKIIARNGAFLTVNGDFKIEGELVCEGGPLILVVNGDLNVTNKIVCERPEGILSKEIEETGNGILVAVTGLINFEKTSEIVSNANIQITDDLELLAETKEEIEEIYQEIAKDTGEGQRFGPIIFGEEEVKDNFVDVAYVQDPDIVLDAKSKIVKISGKLIAEKANKEGVSIILFNFPNAAKLILGDLDISGSDGLDGIDDKGNSCEARAGDGLAGTRFLAQAPKISINNFFLRMGNGGKGGEAETKKDCNSGIAVGGNGGESGNFKIVANDKFDILGPFIIYPGKSGNGGNAIAYGKNGELGENAGDAWAKGGDAKDNKGYLKIAGTIYGINNILAGSINGGAGGKAIANPGNGGDGEKCQNGGKGGDAQALGGKAGDVSLFLPNNMRRTIGVEDLGGAGGDVWAQGGKGGDGGNCTNTLSGGKGGDGGSASATEGKAGTSQKNKGTDGLVLEAAGGNGGNGGDGCLDGFGGAGGQGNPSGLSGANGKNICQIK